MFDYLAMQSTATSMLVKFGVAATFSRTSGSTFNPGAGGYTGGSSVTVTGKAVRTDYRLSEIDGEVIQRGDFKLLFGAAAGAPEIGDAVAFNGVTYRCMGVDPASPADVVVMYVVRCRR